MSPATHEVQNQPPPLVGHDVFSSDLALAEAVDRHGASEAADGLAKLGRLAGSEEAQRWGSDANRHPPALRTHDRYGNRVDEVDFHPAWHRLLEAALGHGLHASPWREGAGPSAHVARAAGFYVWSQVEAGHGCPVSMTYAAVPALRVDPDVAAEWVPRLTSGAYDVGLRPSSSKAGSLAGMGMTEKQGGSDVRANTTRATPLAADGEYALTGHKWFCSAPMSDVFLVLAHAPGGLTCFVLPRVLPDGTRNPFAIQRLKDKLGNRSNASSEVEFADSWARRLGEEGRGVPTIIGMVGMTRLDCVLGSAALMRAAVAQATHHAAYREAFGSRLIDKPLMANVLADLAVESEAATALGIRLAAAMDAGEQALLRIALPVAKYWVCKRTPAHVGEALECLGGNGYVEESGMPRLYREAPLNSIWEGSGSVNALDLLRALQREPVALDAFLTEVGAARGAERRLDAAITDMLQSLADLDGIEGRARRLAERLALVLQGSLLVRYGDPAVADAFCASRLDRDAGATFGTLPRGVDASAIVARARPPAVAR
ncbi:MAG: isovaleryl-CoA dehydrogenase [Actinomycetes bacterium]